MLCCGTCLGSQSRDANEAHVVSCFHGDFLNSWLLYGNFPFLFPISTTTEQKTQAVSMFHMLLRYVIMMNAWFLAWTQFLAWVCNNSRYNWRVDTNTQLYQHPCCKNLMIFNLARIFSNMLEIASIHKIDKIRLSSRSFIFLNGFSFSKSKLITVKSSLWLSLN